MSRISDNDLKIELAAPPGWTFTARDTVIGSVIRSSSIVSPDAVVTVSLQGFVKTEISDNSRRDSTHSSSWQLLEGKPQTLFHGPIHISHDVGDKRSWQFSLNIKPRPHATLLNNGVRKETPLPVDRNGVEHHTLPGSCYVKQEEFGTSGQGVIEYYVEAKVQYQRGGSQQSAKATRPIILRYPPPQPGFEGFKKLRVTESKKIRSQRLIPGMAHADLTFSQKTRKLLHSSKVPAFHFKVEFGVPRVIQLDNPAHIPLTVRIVPETEKTSPVIRDVVQMIRLDCVKTTINARGYIQVPGGWSDHNDFHYSRQSDLRLERAFERLDTPVTIPCVEDQDNTIDIGNMFQLVLTSGGLVSGKQRLGPLLAIYPDFVTHNISHRNSYLNWEIHLTIAGESTKATGSTTLKILAED